jgi:hypothetical protein
MLRLAAHLACFICLSHVALAAAWRITQATIVPESSGRHLLVVDATETGTSRSVNLTETVPLDRLTDSFVVEDKFVALGEAGRAQAVVILNLKEGKKEDWFYCYEPRRVRDSWIVYVEYYPSQGSDEPTDVVLLYDVKRDPQNNRLPRPDDLIGSRPLYPIEVGLPIFPEWNVHNHSYKNVASNGGGTYHILGPPFFTYLEPDRLAFVVTTGTDMSNYRNMLAVVDLSGKIQEATSRMLSFPKDQLRSLGEHPEFLEVIAIKQVGVNILQIEIPESVYGVKSISMAIN